MIVHHFVTNALLGMTIKLNIVRIGTIVLYQVRACWEEGETETGTH